MKRLFAMLMLFVFVLSLCGCASSSSIGTMGMLLPVHLHFNYGDQSVNMILPPEEAEEKEFSQHPVIFSLAGK